MSKAEEYLENRLIYPNEKIPVSGGGYVYLKNLIRQYHQSRLKEVSDEIKEEIDDSDDTEEIVFYEGAKWLLDKLKQ